MKNNEGVDMKRSFLILETALLLGVIISACTNANTGNDTENTDTTEPTQATQQATEEVTEMPTVAPTQPPTQAVTTPTEPPTDGVKRNSNTNESVTNFEYMSTNRISGLSYKDCSYDDIVTCYIKNDTNSQNMHYLIDFKNGKIYSAINPNRWHAVEDYPCIRDLTIQEIKDIKNIIKEANTQSWQAENKGANNCCNRLSTIILEYKNGAVEQHSVACCGCGTIQGFNYIVNMVAQLANNNQCERCGNVHEIWDNQAVYDCYGVCGNSYHCHNHNHECYTVEYVYTYC